MTLLSLAHPRLSLTIQPQFKPSAGLPWSSMVKNLPAEAGDAVRFPVQEHPTCCSATEAHETQLPTPASLDSVPHGKSGAPPAPARGSPQQQRPSTARRKSVSLKKKKPGQLFLDYVLFYLSHPQSSYLKEKGGNHCI